MPSNPTQFIYSTTSATSIKDGVFGCLIFLSCVWENLLFLAALGLRHCHLRIKTQHVCCFLFISVPGHSLLYTLSLPTSSGNYPDSISTFSSFLFISVPCSISSSFFLFISVYLSPWSMSMFSVYFCPWQHDHVFCLFLSLEPWECFLFFSVPGSISSSDWRLLKESPSGLFYQQITPFTPNTRK